jgi:hypothetical protein
MNAAIDFDRKPQFVAVEVYDKATNDMLTTKFEAQKAAISEDLPRFAFVWREFMSQLSGSLNLCLTSAVPPTAHQGTV